MSYHLVDSGMGEKLEQVGPYLLVRPCMAAVWKKRLNLKEWKSANAQFSRIKKMEWRGSIPESWEISYGNLQFLIKPTPFGHLGIFPEQFDQWSWIKQQLQGTTLRILNLFAYSGGSTLAAAKEGAQVAHVDASLGMINWAKENTFLNQLNKAPIRWIAEDAMKYIKRCLKRKEQFDGIILDPPSFGRGKKGEVFKIERDLNPLLRDCVALLSKTPRFFLVSCHTPGYTPLVLRNLLAQYFNEKIETGEMIIQADKTCFSVPSGTFARWTSR
ncbi:MAG: class I SAM-dependent methyltransferase [Chlamydiia bacterium]|nr:class I SAM-dependent methyltransferase [Chlamydiia bacterium]